MAEKKTAEPEKVEEDPWDAATPDSLMDGIADRIWKKMGEKADGEEEVEEEPVKEEAPASTRRGSKFASWITQGMT